MTLTVKDISIIAQAAAHDAAAVLSAEIRSGKAQDLPVEARFVDIYDVIFDAVLAKATSAVELIKAHFPGTVVVEQPAPAAPQPPAPVPGRAPNSKDDLWRELIASRGEGWWNNTAPGAKKSPAGPDFKHKTDPEKALWLKYAPGWAKDQVRSLGLDRSGAS